MGEPLGKIPEHLSCGDIELLGKKGEIVAGGNGPAEEVARRLKPPLSRKALDEPERTGEKYSFPFRPVSAGIAA